MRTKQEQHEELRKDLLSLPNTFKKYIQSETDRNWGFIVTPSDNVIYIQHDPYNGYTFSLQYVPSKEHGTGCQAGNRNKGVYELTEELLQEVEKDGMAFAYKLKAKQFKNSKEFFNKYWAKETLEELA